MFQSQYDYANQNFVKRDMFQGNPNWDKGSRAFARPTKAREPLLEQPYPELVPPRNGAETYPGLYAYAEDHFTKRDLVLEYFEAQPWRPLPDWVRKLTRGPRSFRKGMKVAVLA